MKDQKPDIDALHPHPFARFVAILGRGKTKQRPLTLEEARESMTLILRGEALPEEIGAFLMLLRLKEETPEEIAGFVLGARDTLDLPETLPRVHFDWSSYAGKRVQLPWYLLSVMALVGAGFRVVMHGTEGHTPGRVYSSAWAEVRSAAREGSSAGDSAPALIISVSLGGDTPSYSSPS